ncbi:MAG TPA: hypothetical protein VK783_14345 [Bacteroidia bacterium]|jgi:hypothetical protein|nr:hypothetical protein [Bacteroidia bacterium]
MKALSIIGIIVSLVTFCVSYGVFTFRVYCGGEINPPILFPTVGSITLLYSSIFFLLFSIISTIVAFRRKNNARMDEVEKVWPKE